MQSSKRMIESKIQSLGVGSRFKILHDRIITPGDGLIIFQGMQDATAESIKSLEGFRIAWVEEAQPVVVTPDHPGEGLATLGELESAP